MFRFPPIRIRPEPPPHVKRDRGDRFREKSDLLVSGGREIRDHLTYRRHIAGDYSKLLDRKRATADSIMLNHEDRAGDYVIGYTGKEAFEPGFGFSL